MDQTIANVKASTLAVVDFRYKFIMVDVGTGGRAHDAATGAHISSMGTGIRKNLFDFSKMISYMQRL